MIRLPKILKRRPVANYGASPVAQDEVRILQLVANELHASFLSERAHLMTKLEQAQKRHEPTAELANRLKAVNHKLMQFEQKARRNG